MPSQKLSSKEEKKTMPSQKLSPKEEEKRCLAIAQSMFNNRPKSDDPAKKLKDPFAGKVVKSEVLGQLDSWNEEKAFGFIKTPHDERVFCHTSGFLTDCNLNDFVKFDVWQNKSTGERKAINVTPHGHAFIELARDQSGTMEQSYRLIRGADGKAFQCSEADFEHGSFRRFEQVRFNSVWNGRFKAVNIRHAQTEEPAVNVRPAKLEVPAVNIRPAKTEEPAVNIQHAKTEWSQEEWDQWYSQWSTDEWKAWQRCGDAEQAEDASTVASLSAASLQVAMPKQSPPAQQSMPEVAEWAEVVSKRTTRAEKKLEEKKPLAIDQVEQKKPEEKKQLLRQQCNCCLLPGLHFADKCIIKAKQNAFAEREAKRRTWEEKQEQRLEKQLLGKSDVMLGRHTKHVERAGILLSRSGRT